MRNSEVDEAYILHGNSGASITEHNALKVG